MNTQISKPWVTTQMVQLMLPWFDPAGDLYYSAMSLTEPVKVDRRKAFRIIRKWYKEAIGITVDKTTLEKIWRRRFTTWARTEDDINQYLHAMARETYEETDKSEDTLSKEVTP